MPDCAETWFESVLRALQVPSVLTASCVRAASTFASRIVALADGRIFREGTPLEVLDAELVRAVFGDGLEVVARDGHPGVLPRVPQAVRRL